MNVVPHVVRAGRGFEALVEMLAGTLVAKSALQSPVSRKELSVPGVLRGGGQMTRKTIPSLGSTVRTVLAAWSVTAGLCGAAVASEIIVEDFAVSPTDSVGLSIDGLSAEQQTLALSFVDNDGGRLPMPAVRIGYGRFNVDVTERVRDFVTIDSDRIMVQREVLPAGVHRLTIAVNGRERGPMVARLRLRVLGEGD